MKFLYILLALLGGMMAGIQAPVNGSLGKKSAALKEHLLPFLSERFFNIFGLIFWQGANHPCVSSA